MFDPGSHKINAHGVKDRFRAAQRERGDEAQAGICTVFFEDIEEKSRRGGRGKHLYNGEWNKFPGKADTGGEASDQSSDKVQESRGAQDADRGHQSDECGHDADDCEKSASGAFDKGFIDVDFSEKPIYDNTQNDKWDNKI